MIDNSYKNIFILKFSQFYGNYWENFYYLFYHTSIMRKNFMSYLL